MATSIAITAKDNFTSTMTSIRNATQAFSKDIDGTNQRLGLLKNTQASLQTEMKLANSNINEAAKELKKAKEGTDEYARALAKLEEAYSDRNNLADSLREVTNEARQAEREIRNLSDSHQRLENRAGIGGAGSTEASLLSSIATSGAISMAGNALSGIANTLVSSAGGTEASALFSNSLSSAAMGAAIGSAIAPGLGTAVGAALGGVVGLAQGATQIFENRDENFKGYVEEQYSTVTGAQDASLQSGTGIAATREGDLRRFGTLLDGDTAAAEDFQKSLIELGRTPPFSYDTVAELSTSMLGLGNTTEDAVDKINNLGEAAAALNMSSSDVSTIVSLMESARESGQFESRVLKTLTRKGINVYEAIAQSFVNETTGEQLTEDMVADIVGKLDVDEVIDAIYKYMGREFEGAAEGAASSYAGLSGILDSYKEDIDAAMGVGYNEERKKGLEDEIDYMSGENGEAMKEAYNQIGQWQASLENLQEQYNRDAMSSVMNGIIPETLAGTESETRLKELAAEYAELSKDETEEAGAKMGALLAEAQAIAINEYNASEGKQIQLNTQLNLAEQIRDDSALNELYYDAGYRMGEQFSKGLAASFDPSALYPSIDYSVGSDAYLMDRGGGFAFGLSNVPYDNFPARLHEGERVLTAAEARAYNKSEQSSYGDGSFSPPSGGRAGAVGQIVINTGDVTIREEADIDKFARALADQIQQAAILAI